MALTLVLAAGGFGAGAFGALLGLGGGVLIALGLLTTPVALLASGEMAVAYFKVHAPKDFWPILNHGELPVLFCFAFLAIAARGPGVWSADSKLGAARG